MEANILTWEYDPKKSINSVLDKVPRCIFMETKITHPKVPNESYKSKTVKKNNRAKDLTFPFILQVTITKPAWNYQTLKKKKKK